MYVGHGVATRPLEYEAETVSNHDHMNWMGISAACVAMVASHSHEVRDWPPKPSARTDGSICVVHRALDATPLSVLKRRLHEECSYAVLDHGSPAGSFGLLILSRWQG